MDEWCTEVELQGCSRGMVRVADTLLLAPFMASRVVVSHACRQHGTRCCIKDVALQPVHLPPQLQSDHTWNSLGAATSSRCSSVGSGAAEVWGGALCSAMVMARHVLHSCVRGVTLPLRGTHGMCHMALAGQTRLACFDGPPAVVALSSWARCCQHDGRGERGTAGPAPSPFHPSPSPPHQLLAAACVRC
jgi:hypothetical protein